MADVRHWNDPPEGVPAAVISRVIIHVDGSPGAGKTTFIERLLGGVDEWALAVRCRRDERLSLLAGIDRARAAPPPTPTEHWAVAAGYAGIEHAQLVVLNAREDAERRRAQGLLEEVRRLRVDRAVFTDVLGWRGSRVPITAVVADLADPRDAETRKAVARVRRSVRDVPGRYGRGRRRSHPT